MPALPTSGLTLHVDAKDTDNLFTTLDGGGNHSGVPGDGVVVQVWDDEGDGIADVCVRFNTEGGTYRSTTPLMRHPCLDFDGADDLMGAATQDGSAGPVASDFITNSAFTLIVAFYPEVIDNTASTGAGAEAIVALSNLFCGLTVADASGVKKLRGYNHDGSEDIIEHTIETGRTWIAVFQHSGGNLKLSVIDDTGSESAASDVASGNTSDLTAGTLVGGQSGGVRYDGRIGEFAIWNTALSGQDLADAKAYFSQRWVAQDSPIWLFPELTVPVLADLLATVDDPSGTPITKKLALTHFAGLTVSNVVVQVKTVGSGTYTPTASMKKVLAIAVGGGGGGAGGINTDSAGGGGGGGGTVIRLMTAADIGASKAYVVGGGGAATSNGTATTLDAAGALMNAGAGQAGTAGATFSVIGVTVAGGAGGSASNGDLNIPGERGERGVIFSATEGQGGKGGRTAFGFGAQPGGVNVAGVTGQAYGGGGSGGHAAAASDRAGAAGADGILYFVEFLS